MIKQKLILINFLLFFIVNFSNIYSFDKLPLNFEINKINYENVIQKIKQENYIYSINKRSFHPISKIITVKIDNNSEIKLIKLVFDTEGILKTKVYFINYKYLQKYINNFKNKYKVIKFLKNPIEQVKIFMLFDIDMEKAGIIEFRKGKSFFSLRIVDKKFFAEVLNNLKKEIIKIFKKINKANQ